MHSEKLDAKLNFSLVVNESNPQRINQTELNDFIKKQIYKNSSKILNLKLSSCT